MCLSISYLLSTDQQQMHLNRMCFIESGILKFECKIETDNLLWCQHGFYSCFFDSGVRCHFENDAYVYCGRSDKENTRFAKFLEAFADEQLIQVLLQ